MTNIMFKDIRIQINAKQKVAGTISLPLVRTHIPRTFNLAGEKSFDWAQLKIYIEGRFIPMSTGLSSKFIRALIMKILTNNSNVKSVNLDDARLNEIYNMSLTTLFALTDKFSLINVDSHMYFKNEILVKDCGRSKKILIDSNFRTFVLKYGNFQTVGIINRPDVTMSYKKLGNGLIINSSNCMFKENELPEYFHAKVNDKNLKIFYKNECVEIDDYVAITDLSTGKVKNLWIKGHNPFQLSFFKERNKLYECLDRYKM